MSRKPQGDDGSLDLLLDTICNTFGGVLFISILVVLLLNMSTRDAIETPPSETAQAQLAAAQNRLTMSNSELDELLTAIETQEQIADQIVSPDLSKLVRKCSQLQRNITQAAERKIQGMGQVAKDQLEINQKSREIEQFRESLQNAQRNLAGIQQRLQQEIQSRTEAAKLPKGRGTSKTEIPMFLRAGRLCTYVKRGPAGLEENLAEIAKRRDDQNRPYIEPKPGTGVHVNLEGATTDLDARLNDFDPEKHYLAVFVWPDSFPNFGILKDRMVVQEFEYRLIPFTGEQKIFFGANEQPVEVQ